MRRFGLIIFLVCLMTTSVFATNSWRAATGSWGTPPGAAVATTIWSSAKVPDDTEDIKIVAAGTACDLDVNTVQIGQLTNWKVCIGGNTSLTTVLNIKPGGKIKIGREFKVGDASAGGAGAYGTVVQTGGDVVLNTDGNVGKLEIGYKFSATNGPGTGYYTMSAGTISGTGSLYVGTYGSATGGGTTGSGSTGTFTIQSTDPSISVANLFVAVSDPTAAYTGTGNVKFELNNGVSPITTTSDVYIDPTNNAAAVANLVVTLVAGPQRGDIVLVKNGSAVAVHGVFDSVTLNGLNNGYHLVYNYNADGGAIANDIALIPEPATIALFGLGLLALVRRPRRK